MVSSGFSALPGGPEMLVLLILYLILPFVLAYWIYTDAEKRGEDYAPLWALAAGLFSYIAFIVGGILVLVVYIWQRGPQREGVDADESAGRPRL